ncbi:MAG TPA: hypothetical protein VM537_06660 [Anaerolineae bacterium]|nr:hypothetical protein [Anaerolineae bacterium]
MGRSNTPVRGLNLAPYVNASLQASEFTVEAGRQKRRNFDTNIATLTSAAESFGQRRERRVERNRQQANTNRAFSLQAEDNALAANRFEFNKAVTYRNTQEKRMNDATEALASVQQGLSAGVAVDPTVVENLRVEYQESKASIQRADERLRQILGQPDASGRPNPKAVVKGAKHVQAKGPT